MINPNDIVYEKYNVSDCNKYNFITFELLEDYKDKKGD